MRATGVVLALAVLAPVLAAGGEKSFSSVDEALGALNSNRGWSAVEYLAEHPKESVEPLLTIVKQGRPGPWISANSALLKSRDPRVAPFYIELLANNLYEKEADGSRKVYGLGTRNGCTEVPFLYGGILAQTLGELGDRSAVPVLRDAVTHGDDEVRRQAYVALYRLGALSADDLFEKAKADASQTTALLRVIHQVACLRIRDDPSVTLRLLDRIVTTFPEQPSAVAAAHSLAASTFETLRQYDDAIRELDQVAKFSQFPFMTERLPQQRQRLLDAKARPDSARPMGVGCFF
jgi:hypothetical protein